MNDKKCIIVVDDEAGVLRFVKTNLELASYEVHTTTSGEEAVILARDKNPDVMLVDMLMTPLTGFDVLVQVREFSQVPIIIFTARDDVAELAAREGANEFLTKPFKPKDLLNKVEFVLAHV